MPRWMLEMKLHYWPDIRNIKNFGDELNPVIWSRLLPGFFDDSPEELFLGIGTILNSELPRARRTVVMGSGCGYGKPPEKAQIDTWSIYCVRGMMTAKLLGVPSELVATDPAIMIHDLYGGAEAPTCDFAYMPHWTNMDASWKGLCEDIGIRLIDPLGSVDEIITAIKQSRIVIAEAMHAAIVADALRIPWIAVDSSHGHHSPFKWQDWCSSLNLNYQSHRVTRLWTSAEMSELRPKQMAKRLLGPSRIKTIMKEFAALKKSAKPCLSEDRPFFRAKRRLEEAIERFKQER